MDTLASVVAGLGPLTEPEAVGWTIRLCKRLEVLHRLGVAHGGISATAVRIGGPTPRSPGSLADVREAQVLPAYHSPERQGPSGVSTADDAWAVGVTLYFLLTGSLPFPGDSLVEVRQRMGSPPPPLSVFGVDDEALQRLIDRFLARTPAQRVARITVMRELLEAWEGDPSLRDLPALEEVGGGGPVDHDDDDENAATQMRDVADIQAIMAQMRALNAKQPPVTPGAGPDMRRGTLLGMARPQVPGPSAPAAPPPAAAPPSAVALPPARAPRQLQPTLRSAGVPAAAPAPAPAPKFEDDIDDGVGATLMLDAGGVDVSAAIEEALRRNASAGAPMAATRVSGTTPSQGGPNSIDLALDTSWEAAGRTSTPPAQPLGPPAQPIGPSAEGRGLKIALAVGVVLLVIVVTAVAWLYLKTKGVPS